MHSKIFRLFQQEGFLSRSSIINGFNALLKASTSDTEKGNYYSGLFQLSIGIERLEKIIIMIDYMANNEFKIIPFRTLRNDYSHDIYKLYIDCSSIFEKYIGTINTIIEDSNSIEYKMVRILSDYALKNRYYNIDKITNSTENNDPLADWWNLVIMAIIDNDITIKKRELIVQKAVLQCDAFGSNTFTYAFDFNGNLMTLFDAYVNYGLSKISAPYQIWYLISILNPLYKILLEMIDIIDNADKKSTSKYGSREDIPYMYEFYSFLYADKRTTLRRKKWNI